MWLIINVHTILFCQQTAQLLNSFNEKRNGFEPVKAIQLRFALNTYSGGSSQNSNDALFVSICAYMAHITSMSNPRQLLGFKH